jgi:hypothetical protein
MRNSVRFEVKLDEQVIGYSDLENHGDRAMGGASGRFVPASAYAAVRQRFLDSVDDWVPMPNLTLWLAGGGPVECVGGIMVMDYSVDLGKETIELNVGGITFPSFDELFPDWSEIEKRNRKGDAEAILAKDIQAYLSLHGRDDEGEQEQLQKVCSALDHLLALLLQLQESKVWDQNYWNDGVIASAEISSPSVLDLQGLAIWAKDNTSGFYWEPFAAVVRISKAGDLVDYQIKFADATWGLGKVAWNTRPRGWNCTPPQKWMFEFSGGSNLAI